MRRPSPTRGAKLIVAAVVLTMVSGAAGANAATTPLWIEQNGNGDGETVPILEDFNVREVLFNGSRFPFHHGGGQIQRPTMKKFAAYGTIEPWMDPVGQILARVAVASSDDGTRYEEPRALTIHDSATGEDVPLIVNDATDHFGVVYGNLGPRIQGEGPENLDLQFGLYYRDHQAPTNSFSSLHVALSADGVSYTLDQNLAQSATNPVLNAGEDTFGPTQVILQPSGAENCHTTAQPANFPWNCRFVMVIPTVSGGLERMELAGSGDGLTFAGRAAPVLTPGAAGSWDDKFISLAHVSKISNTSWVMYYSGGNAASANQCFNGVSACFDIGVATSADGVTWTKAAHNPITPRALYEDVVPGRRASLWYPVPVNETHPGSGCIPPSGTKHVYLSVIRANGTTDPVIAQRDFWHAREGVVPGQAPTVRIDNPVNGPQPMAETAVEAYVTDTLGSPPGVNVGTLQMTLDAAPVTGFTSSVSIVGAYKQRAYKIVRPNFLDALADGLHVLTISVSDVQGNVGSSSVTFSIDRTAPETALVTPAASPRIGVPILTSLGAYEGQTTDATSKLLGLRAIVRNPLGLTKSFEVRKQCNGDFGPITSGFSILSQSPDGKAWGWRWIAPTLDPHMALPGPYMVSVVGIDANGTAETPDPQNSAEVLVL